MFQKVRISRINGNPNQSMNMSKIPQTTIPQLPPSDQKVYQEFQDEDDNKDSQKDIQELQSQKDNSKVQMAKEVSPFMSLAFVFSSIGATGSLIAYFDFAMKTGGPMVIFWGWISVSLTLMITAFCFAEIVSAYPFAGSVYIWTGKLCVKEYAPVVSYFCGNFIFLGALANVAAYIISNAQILNYLIFALYEYNMSSYELVLIALFICITQCLLNCLKVEFIGYMNEFIAVYITFASLIVYIFFFFTDKSLSSNEFVFDTFFNESNISNDYYVIIIGLMVPVLSQMGFDAAGQLGEETPDAETVAPKTVIGGLFITQLSGLGFIIGMLYAMCLTDKEELTQFLSSETRNDNLVVHIFENLIQGQAKRLILILASMTIFFLIYVSDLSQITYTMRTCYALARDDAIPFSNYFKQLDPQSQTPLNSLYLIFGFQILFMALYIVSVDAFNAIGGISTVGYIFAYILTQISYLTNKEIDFSNNKFQLGKWSRPINFISVIILTFYGFSLFLPQMLSAKKQITLSNFNWNIVVTFTFIIFLTVRWHTTMKHFFKGPNEKSY